MAKRKRRTNADPRPELNSVSPNKPRLDPQERLLCRFYEPLVLLYTLGSTREERMCAAMPSRDYLAHLPLKDLRRIFLSELAYVCDYDKGGETVAALGLQTTPQGHIFWVASNTGSGTKVIPFLNSLLTKLTHISTASNTADVLEEVVSQCIRFATPRIKKYRSHLVPQLRRCTSHLTRVQVVTEPGLVEWLQKWEHVECPSELCRSAYIDRKSTYMCTLARLSTEPSYKSNREAIRSVFGMIRHYIGRLGYHFRAADILVSCSPRLMDLLHDFQVCAVTSMARAPMPMPDQLTRVDKMLVRMLPANSPDLEHYQQALVDMDSRYQVFDRFLENYAKPHRNPCVHAEIQVLEQFYAHKMYFAGDDPYIACSKPACYCCLLYFRNHPGHVVEPMSHNKIYLNWRPPDFRTPIGITDQNHQRDILNAMNQQIRKEALRQIRERTAPKTWHPDSNTGITQSYQSEQAGVPSEQSRLLKA
ncbi:hypothetical protein IQ07DRAFT_669315 [Pyrenochaeta sp. DS3sAY3a]|nr:hypothetical protein IQ07DRAFT_669315 [Pyrenochaeta sp. DS3sAY3a]